MTNHNENWNEKALIAWDQWKAICSICGCLAEQQKILMVEVSRAFKKKFHSVIGTQLDSLFSPDYCVEIKNDDSEEKDVLPSQSGRLPTDSLFYKTDESSEDDDEDASLENMEPDTESGEQDFVAQDDSGNEQQDDTSDTPVNPKDYRVNWAHEFDCGIIEKANSPTSPKNYKDHTWECIQRSDDPPLKIIRGQLLGFQGIINEIAERFLRNNFHQIWEKQTSLQTPVGPDDEDSGTLEDVFEDKSVVLQGSKLDKTDEVLLRNCFQNLLPNDNAAIFLVYLTGFSTLFRRKVSIAIPELQEFVGLSSTSPLYDRLNNVILPQIQTLPKECLQAMSASGASDFLIFLMMEQIRPEKRAFPLLQRVNDGMKNSTGEEN
ncbi:MAG TPA: hypothetical protein DE060_18705 [Lentisphaeria bacterium]|nr:hypothetical protein [Lentisphaeria bacterium]HCG51220.1 hypothetical protein [Lentisphaeria bacterium]